MAIDKMRVGVLTVCVLGFVVIAIVSVVHAVPCDEDFGTRLCMAEQSCSGQPDFLCDLRQERIVQTEKACVSGNAVHDCAEHEDENQECYRWRPCVLDEYDEVCEPTSYWTIEYGYVDGLIGCADCP